MPHPRALALALFLVASPALAQQSLGHRILGTLGLDAGTVAEPGLYVADRFVAYEADSVVDRHGATIPLHFQLNAFANGFGLSWVTAPAWLPARLSVSVAMPLVHVSLNVARPEGSADRFGFGDAYIQPLKLGWKWERVELVTGYALYVPTSTVAPGGVGSLSRSQWTHELSVGGAVTFDAARTWRLSALASGLIYQRKEGVDITRGATVQVQGGAGKRLFGFLDVGLAGYALWQVADDTGSALPNVLRGVHERAFGLGPAVDAMVPSLRSRFTARLEQDFGADARPVGRVFVLGWTFRF